MVAAKPLALPITPDLIAELKFDEGFRPKPYLCTSGVLTIGYGHTGTDVKPGVCWTREKAEAVLVADIEDHNAQLVKALPWVTELDPVRLRVLQNMAFNLGIPRLLKFRNTLAAVDRGEWDKAASGMMNSLWATQTGQRAVRLAHMMRHGTKAGSYRP
jgi:lysozyme